MDFALIRLIAYGKNGVPLKRSLFDRVYFRGNRFEVQKWIRIVCTYTLATDVLYCGIIQTSEETAIGRTFGRIAFTGLAASLIKKGSGVGSAMMDLSLRGTAKNIKARMVFVMTDTTVIYGDGYLNECLQLQQRIPDSCLGVEAETAAEEMLNVVPRMIADGSRVIPELEGKINRLIEELQVVQTEAEGSESFEDRDEARLRHIVLQNEITRLESIKKAVKHEFDLNEHIRQQYKPKKSHMPVLRPRTRGLLLFFVTPVIAVGIIIVLISAFETSTEPREISANSPPNTPKSQVNTEYRPVPNNLNAESSVSITETTPSVPSINCNNPRKAPIDILVCADKQLLSLDAHVNGVYLHLRKTANDESAARLREDQHNWLRARGQQCGMSFSEIDDQESARLIHCLKGLYNQRLNQLETASHMRTK